MSPTQILIVEDSPTQAFNLKMTLEMKAFQVKIAPNGEEALNMLSLELVDLILTDIIMPGMSGYDLCRAVKSNVKFRDIPVILLTTLKEEQDIIQGIECGADNFINKPYDPHYLLTRIYQVLNVSKMRTGTKEQVEVEFMGRSLVVNQNTAQILDFLVSSFEEYMRARRLEEAGKESLDGASALTQKAFELARAQVNSERQTTILQSILGSMVEAVVVTDESSNLIMLNKAAEELFSCDADNFPAKLSDLDRFYMPDQVTPMPKERQPFSRAMAGESVDQLEMFLPSNNGSNLSYWLSCNIRTLIDDSGERRGAVLVFRDVTARKQMEQQVRHFYSMITHELRTPLTAIKGSLRLIDGGLAGEITPKTRQLIQVAVSESDRLIALINDILDITKVESGRLELTITDLDPGELIAGTLTNMKTLIDASEISIITELNANNKVLGDRSRVAQVLTNLLGNALKFSAKGTTIHLRTTLPGNERMRFEVIDQGPGIPQDKISLLFKPFQQIDVSSVRSVGGTGLGLHTCHLLMERQGGVIGVDSEIGKGSTFWFELPLSSNNR